MEHFREVRNTLTWHNEGKFEVILVNGVITKLNFWEPGKGPEDTGKCLTSTNFKYLQNVYTCLGELFAFIEDENERLGYKYAREIKLGTLPKPEEVSEENYAGSTMRPLINYGQENNENTGDDQEPPLLRDIG